MIEELTPGERRFVADVTQMLPDILREMHVAAGMDPARAGIISRHILAVMAATHALARQEQEGLHPATELNALTDSARDLLAQIPPEQKH